MEVWWLDLQFHLKSFELTTHCLVSVSNKVLYFHTLQTMHLPIGLASHQSSLLPFLKNSQTRWEWDYNTWTLFLHLVPFCIHTTNLSTHTLAYSQPLNEYITTHQQGTQHCSLHRLPQEYASTEVFALMLLLVLCQGLRHSRSIVESWINQLHDCVNASQLEQLLLWRCCAAISHLNQYQALLLFFFFHWNEEKAKWLMTSPSGFKVGSRHKLTT